MWIFVTIAQQSILDFVIYKLSYLFPTWKKVTYNYLRMKQHLTEDRIEIKNYFLSKYNTESKRNFLIL